ncbi:MAG: hypothetical protein KY391_03320 [Actinobacteria bacterium]|nr:hypothetical protein [Actinomycetota bacterium]
MKDKVLRVLTLGIVTVLSLGACGGDEGVPVDAYATDVCSALSTWVTDIQDRAAKITEGINPGDAEAGKERLQEFMGETVNGTEELIAEVEAAGVPDTEDGEEAAEQIQNGLEDVKAILEEAEGQIDELPTNNPQAFGEGAQEIATSLQEATGEAAASIDAANSEELTDAFGENDECSQYAGAGQ